MTWFQINLGISVLMYHIDGQYWCYTKIICYRQQYKSFSKPDELQDTLLQWRTAQQQLSWDIIVWQWSWGVTVFKWEHAICAHEGAKSWNSNQFSLSLVKSSH